MGSEMCIRDRIIRQPLELLEQQDISMHARKTENVGRQSAIGGIRFCKLCVHVLVVDVVDVLT